MELRGAVSLVTGGNGGLGQRICHALARAGSDVAVVYRGSRDEAESVATGLEPLGVRAQAFQADVTQEADIAGLYERVLRDLGRIDVLVNNAAFNQWVPFPDLEALTPELWQRILHANTTGPFLCSRAVAPIMKRQGRGRIVNISSVAGFAPTGSSIAYAVSKAGLNHLTRCLAVALAPEVLVNCVAPGYMEGTRMSARLDPAYVQRNLQAVALRRPADRDDVADQVVTFARTDSTTGQTVCVDAGRYYH
jgi:3-oxoacyl-[acyl-carrier protein] reductase